MPYTSGNQTAFADGSSGPANARARIPNLQPTPLRAGANKPVSWSNSGFNAAEGYQQLRKGQPFTQSKGALPPATSQPLPKPFTPSGVSQPSPVQSASPTTSALAKPAPGATGAAGGSSLFPSSQALQNIQPAKGAPLALPGAAAGGAATGAAATAAAAGGAALVGGATGEALRRKGLETGALNDNARYPSNTGDLLRDPFGTARDGARGSAQAFADAVEGLWTSPEPEPSGTSPSPTAAPANRQAVGPPAFYGGQEAGVNYLVRIEYRLKNPDGGNTFGLRDFVLEGPISGAEVVTAGSGIFLNLLHGQNQKEKASYSFKPGDYFENEKITILRRADNQPDTSGSPSGKLEPAPVPPQANSPKFGPNGSTTPAPLNSPSNSPFSSGSPAGAGAPVPGLEKAPAALEQPSTGPLPFAEPPPAAVPPFIPNLQPTPGATQTPTGTPSDSPDTLAKDPDSPLKEEKERSKPGGNAIPAPQGAGGSSGQSQGGPRGGSVTGTGGGKPGFTTTKPNDPFPKTDEKPKNEEQIPPKQSGGGCRSKCAISTQNKLDTIQGKQDDLLGALNATGQAVDLSLLAVINSKLGPQVPGGISGLLGTVNNFMTKAWQNTAVDKVLNALNTRL